jgi:hypothetical protein
MVNEKRQGPRLPLIVLECPGCAHEDGSLYCGHPDIVSKFGRPRMREYPITTPAWCPLLPVRKVIGRCAECVHWGPALCPGETHLGARAKLLVLVGEADFGCIYWEAKP